MDADHEDLDRLLDALLRYPVDRLVSRLLYRPEATEIWDFIEDIIRSRRYEALTD